MVVASFRSVFKESPAGTYALVEKALRRYSKSKEKRINVDFFMACQRFDADGSAIMIRGKIDGSFKIFACQNSGGDEFFPVSTMHIDIVGDIVTIEISTDWKNFHEDDEQEDG